MVTALHHVSMIVSSEESVVFYKKLGLEETFRKERKTDSVVILEGFGLQLELFIDPIHHKRATNPENIGLRGLSLKVDNLDSLRTKFDCSPIMIDWFGQRYCITQDPDGIPIQFHE